MHYRSNFDMSRFRFRLVVDGIEGRNLDGPERVTWDTTETGMEIALDHSTVGLDWPHLPQVSLAAARALRAFRSLED